LEWVARGKVSSIPGNIFKEDYVIKTCMDTTACKKLPSCSPHFKLWTEEWSMWFL